MKRMFCVLLVLLLSMQLPALAATPNSQATAAPAPQANSQPAPQVRIWLRRLALTDRLDLWLDAPYTLTASNTTMLLPADAELTFMVREDALVLFTGGMSLRLNGSITMKRHETDGELDGFRVAKNGNLYPADLGLTVNGGQLVAIATLSVEHYLMGVVPYEMSNDFPLEALKAQAVCARTYALAHQKPTAAYDMVDTTDNQVFRGIDPDKQNAIRAVRQTAGVVGTYNGALMTCYYAASNGGQTALPSHVWSGTEEDDRYTVRDDPYDLENAESPVAKRRLSKTLPQLPDGLKQLLAQALSQDLQKLGMSTDPAYFRVDSLAAISMENPLFTGSRCMTALKLSFSWSGCKLTETALATVSAQDTGGIVFDDAPTAAPLNLTYEKGTDVTVTLNLFSGSLMDDLGLSMSGTAYEIVSVTETDTDFVLASRRYGHGVGMSQRGAQQMAQAHKMNFTEILEFYYPKMVLMQATSGLPVLSTPDPLLAATPGPAATPTPRPTLMPVTEALPSGAYYASVENIEDDSSLNLRAAPNTAADILMRLYKHQRLIVLEACDEEGWVHVKTDVIEGYVLERFLQKE